MSVPLQVRPHFALVIRPGVPGWFGHFLSLLSWQEGLWWGGAGIKEVGPKAFICSCSFL